MKKTKFMKKYDYEDMLVKGFTSSEKSDICVAKEIIKGLLDDSCSIGAANPARDNAIAVAWMYLDEDYCAKFRNKYKKAEAAKK